MWLNVAYSAGFRLPHSFSSIRRQNGVADPYYSDQEN